MSTSSENEAPSKDSEVRPKDERPPSIVYGPATPVPLKMTFAEQLDYNAEVRGDRPAVISNPQNLALSFRQLRDRSIRLARAMANDGIGKGDMVAISLGSRVEYFETYFACARLGAALILLIYAYTESEMLALLKDVRPKMMVASPGFAYYDNTKILPKLASEIPSIEKFVIMDDIAQEYSFSEPLGRSAR